MVGAGSLSNGGPSWKIVKQPEATGQDASGNFVRGRNVTYQLADGTTGTVFIPAANLTPDFVKAAVQDDAERTAAIAKLTSES